MIAQGRGGRIIGLPPVLLPHIRITHYGLARFLTGACSGTGKQGQASLSAYSASKFGIRALTQCAGAFDHSFFPGSGAVRMLKRFVSNSALEFGSHGITVNSYAPGPVKTPMCTHRPCHPKMCF
jgi:NAD(P)-dependent dehydrogenase (short-subunit alcohol dehydrogenase family)